MKGKHNMSKYVDGFVLVVPKDRAEDYRKMAEQGRDTWMKCGALNYFECKGDDMTPPDMGGVSARSFPNLAGAKRGEEVWFSFITFESREHRDKVNALVMKEMDKQMEGQQDMSMPFDLKRMAFGGFQVEVEG